ncbi:MAG: heat-inducible transcriptional repressor HrcA [Blastocatellia bacterium]
MNRVDTDILDDRSREMLALLIRTHISTGEPVGSRTISKLTREGLSAATVRNIISDLEETGYLEQPHTSAGRVPSDKGYRFYVDHILEQTALSPSDESTIQHGLLIGNQGRSRSSAEQVMSRASHLLSHLSGSVGIVVLPNIVYDIIKHIDFVRLDDGRILVITVSRAGLVQDRLVKIDEDLTQDELNRTANFVNESFAGLSLSSIRVELIKRLSEEQALYDQLLKNAILLCEQGSNEEGQPDPEVFVEGASNIITNPDFNDLSRLREILRVFEEKNRLVKILSECLSQSANPPLPLQLPVGIRIGAENTLPMLRGCTIISSSYSYGDQIIGSIGVVGPVRMEYARTIGVVSYIARLLERILTELPARSAN